MLVARFLCTGLLFLSILLAVSMPGLAVSSDQGNLSNSIVLIRGYLDTQIQSVRNGLVINADAYNGYVLTNADPFNRSETFTVLNPVSGAELIAQRIWQDNKLDLAMFKVSGLKLPAIVFSKKSPAEQDSIQAVVKSMAGTEQLSFARGAIRRVYPYAVPLQTVTMMVHDAGVDEERGGVLLVNECNELVGFNLQGDSNGLVRAITMGSLSAVLGKRNIIPHSATARCLSAVELAQRQADLAVSKAKKAVQDAASARERTRQLSSLLEESKKLNKHLEEQTGQAQVRAEMALKRADQIQAEIKTVREEATTTTKAIRKDTQTLLDIMKAERQQSEAEFQHVLEAQQTQFSQREHLVYGILAVLSTVLVVLIFLVKRKPPAAPQKAEKAEQEIPSKTILQKNNFAEYVLDGTDDSGIRYMLRISSDQLNNVDGVIIGRNPTASPYVINHADVSRNHARIRLMKNRLFIEDMKSTNGTLVNGQSITDRGLVSIGDGDQIIIGSIVMHLRILQVA